MHKYLKEATTVRVESFVSNKTFNMKMKKGVGKNSVMLTKDWANAVEAYEIKEDDIWLFDFGVDSNGQLELLMVPLS